MGQRLPDPELSHQPGLPVGPGQRRQRRHLLQGRLRGGLHRLGAQQVGAGAHAQGKQVLVPRTAEDPVERFLEGGTMFFVPTRQVFPNKVRFTCTNCATTSFGKKSIAVAAAAVSATATSAATAAAVLISSKESSQEGAEDEEAPLPATSDLRSWSSSEAQEALSLERTTRASWLK